MTSRPWSIEESGAAAAIWRRDIDGDIAPTPAVQERVIYNIAVAVERTCCAVEARLRACGPLFGAPVIGRLPALLGDGPVGNASLRGNVRATEPMLLERDKRAAARWSQDLTAALCGDPPPGFSALDRRAPR